MRGLFEGANSTRARSNQGNMVCMYTYKFSVDIYFLRMIKLRVIRWCTCSL